MHTQRAHYNPLNKSILVQCEFDPIQYSPSRWRCNPNACDPSKACKSNRIQHSPSRCGVNVDPTATLRSTSQKLR
eukprot:4493817-Lingulodinium_polyedra.AAC.1